MSSTTHRPEPQARARQQHPPHHRSRRSFGSRARALVASVAALALVVVLVPALGAPTASAETVPSAATLARRAADEGIVLLKNENQTLPLTKDREVSVFGRTQVDTFVTGYGSGAKVTAPYVRNILDGLRRNPGITINEDLASTYESWTTENPGPTGRVSSFPEMPVSDELVADAAQVSDAAVVVIGRNAGESNDFPGGAGGYYLTDTEKDMLAKVNADFDHIVVVIDAGPAIDVTWTEDYSHIDSLVYAWEGGQEMGSAVADVLSGDVDPSGRLPQTLATSLDAYPSTANFGDTDGDDYVEDIFVGYRYFETFAKDEVAYPFGYGLSYTTFSTQVGDVTDADGSITVPVTVTNTGDVPGKQVVEVYYGAPQGQLGKAAKTLAAYAKTSELAPGASETVTLTISVDDMASYDDGGYTGHDSAWVLEAGDYPIYLGTSVRDTTVVATHSEPETRVTEQLEEALAPVTPFTRWHATEGPDGPELDTTTQQTPVRQTDMKARVSADLPRTAPDMPYDRGDQGIKLIDVYDGKATLEDFMAQLTLPQLVDLTFGAPSGPRNSKGIPHNTSVFAGYTDTLGGTYGIPAISTTDGPTGLKLAVVATDMPIGSMLASTWNTHLVQELFAEIGKEMLLNGSDVLLGPGMDLQRNPQNGRNFEYFSEDPLITGTMAAAVVRGVQSQGVSATPKHFAANNQEVNRKKSDSRVSERALRELYLRSFEIMVTTSHPHNIMGSYNVVNGTHAYQNYDLNQTILRGDWGYDGVLMTDWNVTWSKPCPDISLTSTTLSDNSCRIRSTEDVVMPSDDAQHGDPQKAVEDGDLSVGEVQASARRVLEFAMDSAVFRQAHDLPLASYGDQSDWFGVDQPTQADPPELDSITVDGKRLTDFDPGVVEYTVYTKDYGYLPVVDATAEDGASVSMEQATPSVPATTITVTAADGVTTNRYRVFWSTQPTAPLPEGATPAYVNRLKINGEQFLRFYPLTYDYTIMGIAPDDVSFSDIVAPAGVTTRVTGPDADGTYVVSAESADQRREYRFTFKDVADKPRSDDFDGTELADFWTVESQTDGFTKPDGAVQITTEPGDWAGSKSGAKNVVWQRAAGDWTAESKITMDQMPHQNYHQVGLTVFDDEDNFLEYELEYRDTSSTDGVPLRVSVKDETAGSNKVGLTVDAAPFFPDPTGPDQTMYMQIAKVGTTFTFSISRDGTDFTTVGSIKKSFSEPKLALQAVESSSSSSADPITVTYDYVHVTPADPFAAPVTPITATGLSRITAATDWFDLTSNFKTEASSGDSYVPIDLGGAKEGAKVSYNIDVDEAGYYVLTPQVASSAAPEVTNPMSFGVDIDGQQATVLYQTGGTGGWQVWKTMPPRLVYLDAGLHQLRLTYGTSGYMTTNLSVLDFEPSPVDRSTLADLVDQAKTLDGSGYTSGTWAALEDALTAGSGVLGDVGATEDDVDAAASALSDAIGSLVERGDADLGALGAQVSATRSLVDSGVLDPADYTTDAWDAVTAALTAASTLLGDDEASQAATQTQVDALADGIQHALDGLTDARRGDVAPVQALVEEVDGLLTEGSYADGWDTYDAALAAAKDLVAASPGTVSATDVDDALQALHDAIDGLVPATSGADAIATLRDAAGTARSAQVSDRYTEQSRAALDAPLAKAMQLLDSADDGVPFSDEDVAAVAGPLQDALDGLVVVVDTSSLSDLVDQVRDARLDAATWTPESWAVLQEALQSADALVAQPTSQEDVDDAFGTLVSAFTGLEVADQGGDDGGDDGPGEAPVVVSLSRPLFSATSQVARATTKGRASVSVAVGGLTSGTVLFREGSVALGSAPVQGGTARLLLPKKLSVGTHHVTAFVVATATTTAATSPTSAAFTVVKATVKKLKVKAKKRFRAHHKVKLKVKVSKKLTNGRKAKGKVLVKVGKKTAVKVSVKKLRKHHGKVKIAKRYVHGKKLKIKTTFTPKHTSYVKKKKVTVKLKRKH